MPSTWEHLIQLLTAIKSDNAIQYTPYIGSVPSNISLAANPPWIRGIRMQSAILSPSKLLPCEEFSFQELSVQQVILYIIEQFLEHDAETTVLSRPLWSRALYISWCINGMLKLLDRGCDSHLSASFLSTNYRLVSGNSEMMPTFIMLALCTAVTFWRRLSLAYRNANSAQGGYVTESFSQASHKILKKFKTIATTHSFQYTLLRSIHRMLMQ